MSIKLVVTASFTEAVQRLAVAVSKGMETDLNKSQETCRTYAIGFLSGYTKTQINEQAEKIGEFTEDAWAVAKVYLSMAHRSIAGEYGYGAKLAEMWANGDFSITLRDAYKASAGPRKAVDRIARVVKLLAALSEAERSEVARKLTDVLDNVRQWHLASDERFEVLLNEAEAA